MHGPLPGFVHLHVASGYSLRHGASSPAALVARAAEHGMDALALTDRDGLYGAVKFATACSAAGIAPILGADLAIEPSGPAGGGAVRPAGRGAGRAGVGSWEGSRGGSGGSGAGSWGGGPGRRGPARGAPVRGGASVDPRHPRVVVLALGADGATGLAPGSGWARLCRLVSRTRLRGERALAVSTAELVAEHAVDPATGAPALAVLLGPDSPPGRAVLAGRPDLAAASLRAWRDALPPGSLAVEVVCHQGPPGTATSAGQARRLLALARECGVPAVLANAVRHATPADAPTVDVLDAARRLVVLDERHLDRTSAAGHLAPGADMAQRALEVTGGDTGEARELLLATRRLADRCLLDPAGDLSVGSIHLPEPEVLGLAADVDLQAVLATRCADGLDARYGTRRVTRGDGTVIGRREAADRLADELATVAALGFAGYFLAVAEVCDLVRDMGVRVAARGSGAGSLVCHVLGISGVDPLRHDLVMERFCHPGRVQLPDIDVDVEADRRLEVYEAVLGRFGADRVTCVSMMDTYRVRHAVRDAGAALGMAPAEIDAVATAFPHIRARDVRHALAELPELRSSGLGAGDLDLLFDIVERLDGLPRHVALHPCGVILSDAGLLDRTPVEASWMGFPMTQFDKEDVETVGLLKLDILGVRMQSAMAYAVSEVSRVDGVEVDLDDEACVALDDEATYRLIRSTRTLGCFQIESPGQRELVGKFAPETFSDVITDISLFRPGPVKSDMVGPFLRARQGWSEPEYLHPDLEPVLAETYGVVVFHEQVIRMVAVMTGCSLAQADEVRRALGSREGQDDVRGWFVPYAAARGYSHEVVSRVWDVLKAFASFGFCKAHAAAFALPTYQSAWLKAHHPAAFLAGVLTHDPGMYPKRLILDDARNLGIAVLGLDVNASDGTYRVERVEGAAGQGEPPGPLPGPPAGPEVFEPGGAGVPDGTGYGIRLSLADVKGISGAEVARIVAGRPYASLADFWNRAAVSRPVAERLVLAGAFDAVHGLEGRPTGPGPGGGSGYAVVPALGRRGGVTRRDLLVQLAELDRWSRATAPRRAPRAPRPAAGTAAVPVQGGTAAGGRGGVPGTVVGAVPGTVVGAVPGAVPGAVVGTVPCTLPGPARDPVTAAARGAVPDTVSAARRQSQAPRAVPAPAELATQLALDLGDAPRTVPTLLPEMTSAERVAAELEVTGLDASRHVLDFYSGLLADIGVVRSRELGTGRSRRELFVAGVKVATQTPPIRSGKRVVFLTLDDATGAVDTTFFEDAQAPYAMTVFHSWLLLVRGVLRRTGPRGVSLRATGAWELPVVWDAWRAGGLPAVDELVSVDPLAGGRASSEALRGAAASRAARPVLARPPVAELGGGIVVPDPDGAGDAPLGRTDGASRAAGPDRRGSGAGGMGGSVDHRRVLVHVSGFRQSVYADIKPAGVDGRDARRSARSGTRGGPGRPDDADAVAKAGPTRKLWHASPGSSGR